MENYVVFFSLEGIYVLKILGYFEIRVNVEKIDGLVDNIVYRDINVCGIIVNG